MGKKHLDVRLARYAVMAGAVVAATKPAKATVVYTVDPVPVDFSSGNHSLDVNGDSIDDFFFTGGPLQVAGNSFPWSSSSSIFGSCGVTFTQASGDPSGTGTISVTASLSFTFSEFFTFSGWSIDGVAGGTEAIAFGPGAVIDSNVTSWASEAAMDDFTATGLAFLGLSFYDSNGAQYYGFAEFDPQSLIGFAFENNPGESITTFDLAPSSVPEPGTLGTFALGAAAFEFIRRRRKHRT